MTDPALALVEIRSAIDELDAEIVRLLALREGLVRRAAPLKSNAAAVRAPERAAQVLARVRGLAIEADADPDVLERIYRGIIDAFIDLELGDHKGRS